MLPVSSSDLALPLAGGQHRSALDEEGASSKHCHIHILHAAQACCPGSSQWTETPLTSLRSCFSFFLNSLLVLEQFSFQPLPELSPPSIQGELCFQRCWCPYVSCWCEQIPHQQLRDMGSDLRTGCHGGRVMEEVGPCWEGPLFVHVSGGTQGVGQL